MKRLGVIPGILAALTAAACDTTVTAPSPKYVQVHFVVEINGDASAFDRDGYVAIVDGTLAVPLAYRSQDSLALIPGEHTIELRRTGLASDIAKAPACTSTPGIAGKFNVDPGRANTLEFRFSCGVPDIPDCPTIFCLTPLPTVMLRVNIAATGAHVPKTVRLILRRGIFFPRDDVYAVNTNQTTEFSLERDFYQIGIDSVECPLPAGTFSALPSGIELMSDTDVAISLTCP